MLKTIFTFFIFLTLVPLQLFMEYRRTIASLGEMQYSCSVAERKTGILPHLAMFVVWLGIAVYSFVNEMSVFNSTLLFAAFLGLFVGLSLAPLLGFLFLPIGFYENGVVTIKGVSEYEKLTDYKFTFNKSKQMHILTYIKPKPFKQSGFIYLEAKSTPKIKALLKKHGITAETVAPGLRRR